MTYFHPQSIFDLQQTLRKDLEAQCCHQTDGHDANLEDHQSYSHIGHFSEANPAQKAQTNCKTHIIFFTCKLNREGAELKQRSKEISLDNQHHNKKKTIKMVLRDQIKGIRCTHTGLPPFII